MKNNSLTEIAKAFEKAGSVLFLTHVIMDGDTAGSAAALCRAMLDMGKTAHVFSGESLPDNLQLLDFDGFIKDENQLLENYDVVACIDCSDRSRFEKRSFLFEKAGLTVNIDHHVTNDYYAQLNYVNGAASAAGEIVFQLIREADWKIDKNMAEALYVAIVTDTGEFQYSSTTSETHRIAAELLDVGIDLNEISVAVFQSVRKEKYLLLGEILSTIEFLADGRFAIAYADISMYQRTGADFQDSDGAIEMLRDINTVEVSAFAKETTPGVMKVGMRSKYDINVAEICAKFGGGGHVKASGCTIKGTIEDVKKALYPEIIEVFRKKENGC